MDNQKLVRTAHLLIRFLDWAIIGFVLVNMLDMITTLMGIYLGKVVEANPVMSYILETYGFSGFVLVKVGVSVFFLIPLFLKRFWKNNLWTKTASAGFGIVSKLLASIKLQI